MEIQQEKVQKARDLKDDTIVYQGIRLPCKINQGCCDPSTRTQATIVWFSEDTCTTFQVAKNHARVIKSHQKYFIESIPYTKINPKRFRSKPEKNKIIDGMEKKFTRLQFYPETEVACKYPKPLFKTQNSEIHVKHDIRFDKKKGNFFVHPLHPYQNREKDKNSFFR